jgi:hypothetical protein
MNARKEIRDHLIAERLRRWLMIATTPAMYARCPRWRARKNFWYLVRKFPDLSRGVGYDETSVFRR